MFFLSFFLSFLSFFLSNDFTQELENNIFKKFKLFDTSFVNYKIKI